jgi:hypothetical protein
MKPKTDDTRQREDAQRAAVLARDGPQCAFEKLRAGGAWRRCTSVSAATCHVYRRAECAKAWDHVDVAIRGCWGCHEVYDGRLLGRELEAKGTIRVPPAAESRAWAAIVARSKSPIPRRAPTGERL